MPLGAGVEFLDAPLAAFGVLLVLGALVSGLADRSFLSLTAGFVLAGLVLGEAGFGALDFDPTSEFVQGLAVVALILILFRDGLEVEEEALRRDWHLPLRNLALAMPLTAVLVAVATHTLTDLDWTESFLLGALLSPTDPVLSSVVVTNPRVPRIIRHSLNLESGLNDGLALPAVLAFTAAAAGNEDFVWWRFVLQDVLVGAASGLVVAFLASRLMPRDTALGHPISPHQKSLYAVGVAFAAYGTAVLPPEGNGLIAAFVAAIALGIWRPDIRECFEERSEDLIEIVKLGRVPRVRRDADLREPVRGRLGRRGHRRVHPARGPAGRRVHRSGRHAPGGHGREGVHGLVRPEGSRDDDLRPARARLERVQRAPGSRTSRRWPCSRPSSRTA